MKYNQTSSRKAIKSGGRFATPSLLFVLLSASWMINIINPTSAFGVIVNSSSRARYLSLQRDFRVVPRDASSKMKQRRISTQSLLRSTKNDEDDDSKDNKKRKASKKKMKNASNENDEFLLIQEKRKQQVQQLKEKIRKEKEATAAMDLPDQPVVKTIGGGTSMIFEMARRMAFWESQQQQQQQRKGVSSFTTAPGVLYSDDKNNNSKKKIESNYGVVAADTTDLLPRWHPTTGISSVNPAFRTKSPVMNHQGYAGTIWRNVRKRNKPAMWRYALRTFDRMQEQQRDKTLNPALRVKPTTIHYEGALLACSKLGLADRALQIFEEVENEQAKLENKIKMSNPSTSTSSASTTKAAASASAKNIRRNPVAIQVTDNMVMSVIKTCVRASRDRVNYSPSNDGTYVLRTIQERRAPLDAAVQIAENMEDKYDIPLCAVHLNPLASAYQKLGLMAEANRLIADNLQDRVSGPEDENASEQHRLNIYDVQAKDKGSYSLLVQSAVTDGDWGGAIDALRDMTEAGLYPADRHLNVWTGISERKKKQRATRSWKKKRDEYFVASSVRQALQTNNKTTAAATVSGERVTSAESNSD